MMTFIQLVRAWLNFISLFDHLVITFIISVVALNEMTFSILDQLTLLE